MDASTLALNELLQKIANKVQQGTRNVSMNSYMINIEIL
jgi:hypothetical protein